MTSRTPSPDSSPSKDAAASSLSRRRFVAGAGAVAGAAVLGTTLSACAGGGTPQATVSVPPNAPKGTLALTKDVPVGGGVITDGVVLTQLTEGTIEAFTAKCTHAGCTLSGISREAIICPCHGSRFHLDGTVEKGPAETPLEKVAIRVEGTNIIRA
ncbi:Rieske (2Fe-2S) protein [Gordonia phthalatica]|uniref:Cytochrome bc1 complex Rieske iron-sulfur subunit n=1 Tax=Gordonia phthalatica TaxID=1136941 RepID=A0A0N9NDC0_9ACTN|nr:Rieske (2Fe-2S) protein [Gordonia phthalatica]ALG85060.1 (2Fe-2S)-binding protein [Gordonia phthalatica]